MGSTLPSDREFSVSNGFSHLLKKQVFSSHGLRGVLYYWGGLPWCTAATGQSDQGSSAKSERHPDTSLTQDEAPVERRVIVSTQCKNPATVAHCNNFYFGKTE